VTVEWYLESSRSEYWVDIDSALLAHPLAKAKQNVEITSKNEA
jgi:hypothetical protein